MSEDKLYQLASAENVAQADKMTIDGAINKTMILFSILLTTSVISFFMPSTLLMIVGAIGGLISVLVATFKPTASPVAGPVYAAFEGLLLGSISAVYAAAFEGIVMNAVLLTFGTLLFMLLLYKYRIIKVTEKLRAGIMIATVSIVFVYLIAFIFNLFGYTIPYIHQGGWMGIGFSVLVLGIAALNLLLDFDNFEKSEAMGAPKYMEWYCGLSLLVTLVWLYIEFLRLLAKLREE